MHKNTLTPCFATSIPQERQPGIEKYALATQKGVMRDILCCMTNLKLICKSQLVQTMLKVKHHIISDERQKYKCCCETGETDADYSTDIEAADCPHQSHCIRSDETQIWPSSDAVKQAWTDVDQSTVTTGARCPRRFNGELNDVLLLST